MKWFAVLLLVALLALSVLALRIWNESQKAQGELALVGEELDVARQQLADAEGKNRDLLRRLDELQGQLRRAPRDTAGTPDGREEGLPQSQTDELAKLKETLASAERQNQSLQQEVTSLQGELKRQQQEWEKARDALEQELKEKQKALQDLTQKKETAGKYVNAVTALLRLRHDSMAGRTPPTVEPYTAIPVKPVEVRNAPEIAAIADQLQDLNDPTFLSLIRQWKGAASLNDAELYLWDWAWWGMTAARELLK
ncbi:MAG: hypothetical protein HY686_07060 [Chloroflexi bacterium]|nr:hypothetical protein [Chloroflexota bacterium]